jgi:hypothetical protein
MGGGLCWLSAMVATSAPVASAFGTGSRDQCDVFFGTSACKTWQMWFLSQRPLLPSFARRMVVSGWFASSSQPSGSENDRGRGRVTRPSATRRCWLGGRGGDTRAASLHATPTSRCGGACPCRASPAHCRSGTPRRRGACAGWAWRPLPWRTSVPTLSYVLAAGRQRCPQHQAHLSLRVVQQRCSPGLASGEDCAGVDWTSSRLTESP